MIGIEVTLVALYQKLRKLHTVAGGDSKLLYGTEIEDSKGNDIGIVAEGMSLLCMELRLWFAWKLVMLHLLFFLAWINLGPLLVV